MNQYRNLAVWGVIALLLFALFSLFQGQVSRSSTRDITYTELVDKVNSGEVVAITISGENASGKLRDGNSFTTTLLPFYSTDIVKLLSEKGVKIETYWKYIIEDFS